MTWAAFIVVVWSMTNPAAPNDRSAVIWKADDFTSEIACMDALAANLTRAHAAYDGIKTVTLLGDCVPLIER